MNKKLVIFIIAVVVVTVGGVLFVRSLGRRGSAEEAEIHEADGEMEEMEEVLASGEGISSEAGFEPEVTEAEVPEEINLTLSESFYTSLLGGMVYVKGSFSNDEYLYLDDMMASYASENGYDPASCEVRGYTANIPDENGDLHSEYSLIFDGDDSHTAYLALYPSEEGLRAEIKEEISAPPSEAPTGYYDVSADLMIDDYSDMGGDIAQVAETYIGTVNGGLSEDKESFNNLSFVVHVLNTVGALEVTPTSYDGLFAACASTSNGGNVVPGDLIFFSEDGKKIDHVGIYTDEDTMVYMGQDVRQVRISEDPYWSQHIYRYGRVYND